MGNADDLLETHDDLTRQQTATLVPDDAGLPPDVDDSRTAEVAPIRLRWPRTSVLLQCLQSCSSSSSVPPLRRQRRKAAPTGSGRGDAIPVASGPVQPAITHADNRPPIMRVVSFPRDGWLQSLLAPFPHAGWEDIVFSGTVSLYWFDNAEITMRDLGSMQNGMFIRDEVLHVFRGLINMEVGRRGHIFTTQFSSKLLGSRFRDMLVRYERAISPLDFEFLFFPVNINNCHWVLVVASIANRELIYLDSLFNPFGSVPLWVSTIGQSMNARLQTPIEWTFRNGKAPQQAPSGNDCALAVMYNTLHILQHGAGQFTYDSSLLRGFRQRLKLSILYQSLDPVDADMRGTVASFWQELVESGRMSTTATRRRSSRLKDTQVQDVPPPIPLRRLQDLSHLGETGRHDLGIGVSFIPKAGLGLFACRDYKAGEFVGYYTGPIIPASQVKSSNSKYLLRNPVTNEVIDGADKSSYVSRANDHLDGEGDNTRLTTFQGKLCLRTTAVVASGQEMYTSYGNDFWFSTDHFHLRVAILGEVPSRAGLALGSGARLVE